MDDIIANVDNIRFDIEVALEEQVGIQPLPFPGMDSKHNKDIFNNGYIVMF